MCTKALSFETKSCSFSCTSEFYLFSSMQLLKSGVEFEAVLMEYCWEIFKKKKIRLYLCIGVVFEIFFFQI